MELISVVMPVFNSEKYILDSIDSILSQTYTNFELLILDDCSTDNTLRLVESRKFDDRIKIFKSKKNLGQAAQFNRGIHLSTGNFIAISHSDDISLPTRLEKQYNFLKLNNNFAFIGTSIFYSDDSYVCNSWNVPDSSKECFYSLLENPPIAHPTVMFNRSLIYSGEFFYNQDMVPAEDYDLWVRLSKFCTFSNLSQCLVLYRLHENQVSKIKSSLLQDKLFYIRFKYLKEILLIREEKFIREFCCNFFDEKKSFKTKYFLLLLLNEKNIHFNIFEFRNLIKFWIKRMVYKCDPSILDLFLCFSFNRYFPFTFAEVFKRKVLNFFISKKIFCDV
jgi:glycosyltransferase involved in cell wall biosynthesis